jgi:hypothetical protein
MGVQRGLWGGSATLIRHCTLALLGDIYPWLPRVAQLRAAWRGVCHGLGHSSFLTLSSSRSIPLLFFTRPVNILVLRHVARYAKVDGHDPFRHHQVALPAHRKQALELTDLKPGIQNRIQAKQLLENSAQPV